MIFVMSRAQGFAVEGFLGSAVEMWVQVLPHSSASFANPPSFLMFRGMALLRLKRGGTLRTLRLWGVRYQG